MIIGVGIDIVNVARIDRAIRTWGERFLHRVFSHDELNFAFSQARPALHLAGRFAAKEAVLKGLGTGLSAGMSWRNVEVLRDPSGRPSVRLTGPVRDRSVARGVAFVHISLSHDREYAVAQAVLEGISAGGGSLRT